MKNLTPTCMHSDHHQHGVRIAGGVSFLRHNEMNDFAITSISSAQPAASANSFVRNKRFFSSIFPTIILDEVLACRTWTLSEQLIRPENVSAKVVSVDR